MRIRGAPTWSCFFFNDTATPEIYTLSLHDALPILASLCLPYPGAVISPHCLKLKRRGEFPDRKSTRLNSSHHRISYAVFCLENNQTDCDDGDSHASSGAASPSGAGVGVS